MKVLSRKTEIVTIGWRPDFRDQETLPDTKVVRTSFFLSAAFFAGAVAIAMFLGFREYQKSQLEIALTALQMEVDSMKSEHVGKVKENGEFLGYYSRIEEMNTVRSDQMIGSDLLISVASSLSPQMVLTQLQYDENSLILQGTLDVGAAEASLLIDEYIGALKEANADQGILENYDLLSIQRKGSQIIFKLSISKPEGKK